MAKIHRGICPDTACERVAIEVRRQKSERAAFRVVAKELGVSPNTVKSWAFRNKVGATAPIEKKSTPAYEAETFATLNLHTLTHDSGKKKLVFKLHETDGNRSIVIQEFKVGKNGKEITTKNRFTLSVDLFFQFRGAMDAVAVIIQKEYLVEPDIDGPHSQGDDEVEPLADDDGGLSRGNEVDGTEAERAPSPAPVDCTNNAPRESGPIPCADCHRYAPGLKLKDKEMNGSCQSQALSWDGELMQPPYELHPCPNFSPRDQ